MKILVTGLVNSDQLLRLREEAEKRGHTVDGAYTSELILYAENGTFEPTLRGKPFSSYDLIYMWVVGKRRWEWYTAMLYVNKKYGTTVLYRKTIDPRHHYYLTPGIDYLMQVEHDLPFPKSAVLFNEASAKAISEKFEFPAILKLSGGRKGKGVFKVESLDQIKSIIKEHEEAQSFVLREFIPNDGDIRIFTVGYRAIGAMKRTPKKGDFRSNISQGGSGEVFDLDKSPRVREIAEKLSLVMQTEIAGVDIILHKETGDPYILEINPGPQFTGLEEYTGVNAALEIVKYFEESRAKDTA